MGRETRLRSYKILNKKAHRKQKPAGFLHLQYNKQIYTPSDKRQQGHTRFLYPYASKHQGRYKKRLKTKIERFNYISVKTVIPKSRFSTKNIFVSSTLQHVVEEMPKRTLADKGIAGPTAAHVIEDVHTPLNLAYLTFTTGTSAFQNIVGVTYAELPARIRASVRILERAGLKCGDKLLVTYPPLVNVFSGQALKDFGLKWSFLVRSSRDAFLAALYKERPAAVVGESAFLRAALTDAKNMGVAEDLPKGVKLLTAGTPLDLELLPVAQELLQAEVHDLYGCQEIGWLAMDGIPVRDDIELTPAAIRGGQQYYELIAGGLPMGDSFPCSESGHVCNKAGKIITYRRERTYPEYEVIVKATTLASAVTLNRVARSILRIKGRIVKVSPEVQVNAEQTILELRGDPISGIEIPSVTITGPVQTEFFDTMVQAQLDYQQNSKADPVWTKRS